jgi:aspartate aminotransferase-like enzyme
LHSKWDRPVTVHTGKHFLQIPGPTNVPDRVLRAMDMPTIDHRVPEFAQSRLEVLELKGRVFRIGHLGHFNELMLMGRLAGVEMALDLASVPHRGGGVLVTMNVLTRQQPESALTGAAFA